MDTLNKSSESTNPKKKRKKFIVILFLLLAVGFFIYYLICGMTYSEGTRSGVLTKVSKKGIIFKTYEGELNVGGFNQGEGTIMPASIFKFSTTEKVIYDQLEAAQGNKVVLHYKQVIKNFFWQGETDYFIYKLSTVK
jgi:hypothetical protein